jgi:hypothetical protein
MLAGAIVLAAVPARPTAAAAPVEAVPATR